MTKKQIFYVVAAVILIGIGIYLKFAGFGDAVMSLFTGAVGIIIGFLAKGFYDKYVKEEDDEL